VVAEYKKDKRLLERVARIYKWLDTQIRDNNELAGRCNACGKCCVFGGSASSDEEGFEHRLFLTPPELMYLNANLSPESIKTMQSNQCPYNIDGKCAIYDYRFAGCRIFCCNADTDFQSRLSESALSKLKSLCTEFQIPYRYHDLATALNNFANA
jgi:hypothetical protein